MNTPVMVENASHITSIHQYLDTPDWNIEGLTKILKQNPSINEISYGLMGETTPFIRALNSRNCTVDIVQLLLDHGADVNLKDPAGDSPLISALWNSAEDKVVEMLLDKGAAVDINGAFGESPLCVAIQRSSSEYVFKRLLDAGCAQRLCKNHGSAMHCFCSMPTSLHSGMRAQDILKLMIEAGAEVSKMDVQERSPMCLALGWGARPRDIELLVQVGVSLNDCKKHPSSFHCLVGDNSNSLEVDVVKTLINAGARFGTAVEDSSTLLQHILHCCMYHSEAFTLLLDVSGVDVNDGCQLHGTLLHCAVSSTFGDLSTVKFMLDKGVEVDKVNTNGDTVLDVAIHGIPMLKFDRSRQDLIKFLVKKGSPINTTQDHTTSKQLMMAVTFCMNPLVVMTLLIAGARIGMIQDCIRMIQDCIRQPTLASMGIIPKTKRHPVFKMAHNLSLSWKGQTGLNCLKCLVKCYGLEYSAFDIGDFIRDWHTRDELHCFAEECKLELRQMESANVGHGRTLHQLISRNSSPRTNSAGCMAEGKDFDSDQLLETLSYKAFPIYFDIISANVGKQSMEKMLQEVPVYTVECCPGSSCTDKKVTLSYDVVVVIAGYLSEAQLLKLILAFYNPKNHAGNKRGNDELNVVDPGPAHFQKRPKLA